MGGQFVQTIGQGWGRKGHWTGDNYLLIKGMTTGTLEGSINEIKGLLDGN